MKHLVDACANIDDPVEVLRITQKLWGKGRALELKDLTQSPPQGETNFILVDRNNLLNTAFDELKCVFDYFITLEVQFYNEVGCKIGMFYVGGISIVVFTCYFYV